MGSGGYIAGIFIISLFLTTFFISYFNEGFNGDNRVKIIDISSIQNKQGFANQTDFTSSCPLSVYDTTGSWSCDSNGLNLVGAGGITYKLKGQHTYDGIYHSSYVLSNVNSEYYIVVTDTASGNYLHVKVLPDGLHVPSVFGGPIGLRFETGEAQFFPISNPYTSTITIETIYNINNNELTVIYNGISYVFDKDKVPDNMLMPLGVTNTQGIVSTNSLTIKSMTYDFKQVESEIQSVIDGLTMTVNLAYSMAKLGVYSFPYDIIPLTLQVLLIAPQEFFIALGVAMFIRGD
jgi:hypothetical protein